MKIEVVKRESESIYLFTQILIEGRDKLIKCKH